MISKTQINDWPCCIYLAGVDGAGKTTQAKILLSLLRQTGMPSHYVWLRFPRIFCVPFLIYARLLGYSRQEVVHNQRYGYWNFEKSWLMSTVFPWALWLDTFLIAIFRLYLPLWAGYTVVCDRFITDILVDLMTGLNDSNFDKRMPGRLFLLLLPKKVKVIIFDLDTETARQRSPDLKGDRSHSIRRSHYVTLAQRYSLPIVSTQNSVELTTKRLLDLVSYPEAT